MMYEVLTKIGQKNQLMVTTTVLEFGDWENVNSFDGHLRISSNSFSLVILVPDFSICLASVSLMAGFLLLSFSPMFKAKHVWLRFASVL